MTKTAVKTEALSKSYSSLLGKTNALKGVTLEIPQGAVVGLLGQNGAGKSTLLRILAGLARASNGTAKLFGEDCWCLSEGTKERLGYVGQATEINQWITVGQLVATTAAFYPNWDRDLAGELAARWQLPKLKLVRSLSSGQKQRLCILLAVAHHPELLLLDEPAAHLDPVARRDFIKSLVDLTASENPTIILSTHQSQDVERVASHVAILKKGELFRFQELDELKEQFRRVEMTVAQPHEAAALSDAINIQWNGDHVSFCHSCLTPEKLTALNSVAVGSVTVSPMSLEDVFLEVHRDS